MSTRKVPAQSYDFVILPPVDEGFSEADLVFEACYALRQADFKFRLEYRAPFKVKGRIPRFDIVLLEGRRIYAIVEWKRGSRASSSTRQLDRYRCYGVPVMLGAGKEGLRNVIAFATETRTAYIAKNGTEQSNPRPLYAVYSDPTAQPR